MRSDVLNKNSNTHGDAFVNELSGVKKVFTYVGSTAETLLDSATTAYTDGDVVANCGALDVTLPDGYHSASKILVERVVWNCSTVTGTTMVGSIQAGTAATDALNAAITGGVELFGAGATYRNQELAANLSITEVDVDFNAAGIMYAPPYIILPVATNNIYVATGTAINDASDFNAGRYQFTIEYTVL